MPNVEGSIMVAEFPRYNSKLAYKKDAESCEYVMGIIKAIRQIRVDSGCAPSKKLDLYVVSERKRLIEKTSLLIEKLANINDIKYVLAKEEISVKVVSSILDKTELYIPLGELVDTEKELVRLNGELKKVEGEIARANGKLNNQGFVAKAPKALIDAEKEKVVKYQEMKEKLMQSIKELQEM